MIGGILWTGQITKITRREFFKMTAGRRRIGCFCVVYL
jgi:hypothetical protein